jgi:hypothetical protein
MSRNAPMCQCGNCLETVGDAGVTVTLKTATFQDEKRAFFCSAACAAAALIRLTLDRRENVQEIPRRWKSA